MKQTNMSKILRETDKNLVLNLQKYSIKSKDYIQFKGMVFHTSKWPRQSYLDQDSRNKNQCGFCNAILGQVPLSPTGKHLLNRSWKHMWYQPKTKIGEHKKEKGH